MMRRDTEGFVWWLTKKLAPYLLLGLVLGGVLGFLRAKSPDTLGIISTIVALLFGSSALLYFYWASQPENDGGYRFTVLERLGVASSGLGALVIAFKLGFPTFFPGPLAAYFASGFVLAFIVRGVLESRVSPLQSKGRADVDPATEKTGKMRR